MCVLVSHGHHGADPGHLGLYVGPHIEQLPAPDVREVIQRGTGDHLEVALINQAHNIAAFEGALWLTGVPFRNLEPMPRFLPGLKALASGSCGIRRFGSAALDLCFVAAGHAEGFWEYDLSRWDISAGALIVEEAGGRVTDFEGGPGWLDSGDICASNGRLHQTLLDKAATR